MLQETTSSVVEQMHAKQRKLKHTENKHTTEITAIKIKPTTVTTQN